MPRMAYSLTCSTMSSASRLRAASPIAASGSSAPGVRNRAASRATVAPARAKIPAAIRSPGWTASARRVPSAAPVTAITARSSGRRPPGSGEVAREGAPRRARRSKDIAGRTVSRAPIGARPGPVTVTARTPETSVDPDRLRRALEVAVAAATAPAPLILAAFRSPALATEAKADGTPVTAADREAEATIRAALRRAGEWGTLEILGEEGGADGEPGPLRWIIDPIDGTRAFARGLPTFGTIVALEETASRRALVGVIHLPAAGETLAAARGLGARRGGTGGGMEVRASRAGDLRTAIVSVPDLAEFRAAGMAEGYHR